MSSPAHQPFIFWQHLTEADIRLFTTVIRFDAAYHAIFRCNLKVIRHDYPHAYLGLRRLYWDDTGLTAGIVKATTNLFADKWGYTRAQSRMARPEELVIPRGPLVDIHELNDDELSLAAAVKAFSSSVTAVH